MKHRPHLCEGQTISVPKRVLTSRDVAFVHHKLLRYDNAGDGRVFGTAFVSQSNSVICMLANHSANGWRGPCD